MADNEDFDDDLFADVYADEPAQAPKAAAAAAITPVEEQPKPAPSASIPTIPAGNAVPDNNFDNNPSTSANFNGDQPANAGFQQYDDSNNNTGDQEEQDDGYGQVGIKEDGKMFIGGLNWETTDESLRTYFSQFGEVTECTVMRDGASGRSRGFGFLTFRDPKVVNTVMVKEHFLDGKIIDPKRAIPREEQERTAKIFVGGVSPEASEQDFKEFFMQFGRVIDATLMIDKDTGRPRGFGFVTFDGDDAVDRALAQPIEIYGKPMEVKRAQPRNALQNNDDKNKFGRNQNFGRGNDGGNSYDQQGQMGGGGAMGGGQAGMTPAMMAKYWFNMQQYFKQMQQNMMGGAQMGMQNPMGGGGMNPMMMAQMMGMGGAGGGGQGGMDPNMMQQMQQMQQMQMQQQQQHQGGNNGNYNQQNQGSGSQGDDSEYDPQQQQQQQRGPPQQQYNQQRQGGQQQGWDNNNNNGNNNMYDDGSQQQQQQYNYNNNRGGFQSHRGGFRGGRNQHTPPMNAPTGPKSGGNNNNASNAGGGFRGAGAGGAGGYRGGGRGGNRGYHPYSRG